MKKKRSNDGIFGIVYWQVLPCNRTIHAKLHCEELENCTENKKGTVPNLKRFRILKRILNLFGFRTKPVRYKTHFRKSRKQVPQKSFYTTDATENGFSRYGTIITSVSL